MILKSITPKNVGPFDGSSTLHLEPDVTVLTGPNDVGKSLALRAIELLCQHDALEEHEVYEERIGEHGPGWQHDPEVSCRATFLLTEVSAKAQANTGASAGAELEVERQVNADKTAAQRVRLQKGSSKQSMSGNLKKPPRILRLPPDTFVREQIDLRKPSKAEQRLLELGFGSEFTLQQHGNLKPMRRSSRIRKAEERLNAHLRKVFPVAMRHSFKLTEVGAEVSQLGVSLVDEHEGYTLLGSRGAGVRKLLDLTGTLLRVDPGEDHLILLYDEPETSLHADAQHSLRRLLEWLGAQPNIQVVYTTHSPSMVNTLRPGSVRLLKRQRVDDRAISVFENKPCGENYAPVRTSLGLSPSDSLLYAPITIVAEGAAEVRCLPVLLRKLAAAGRLGVDADSLDRLLALTHLLDGQGDSYPRLCKLAKSQGTHPIVFLDGDKKPDKKLAEEEIPVICLPDRTELEELVPPAIFIKAAVELAGGDADHLDEEAFKLWDGEQQAAWTADPKKGDWSKVMFSKRVDRWLVESGCRSLDKPRTMHRAIEETPPEKIEAAKLRELAAKMAQIGGTL